MAIKTTSGFPVPIFLPTCICIETDARVGAKSRKRKFVPSSHPGPFVVVASSRKSPGCDEGTNFTFTRFRGSSADAHP